MRGMTFMIVALGLLILPGALYNNVNNNGLAIGQAQTLSCSTDASQPTCQISGNVGCQASSSYCNLSGSSVSFLNAQSPFTALIQGNIFGLFTNLISPAQGSTLPQGPFDIPGGGSYVRANCIVTIAAGGGGLTQWGFTGPCTQANPDNSNASATCSTTTNCASSWANWNAQLEGSTTNLKFFQLQSNATLGATCQYMSQTNYTFASAGIAGWTYYGCDYYTPIAGGCCTNAQAVSKTLWSVLYAVPYSIGKLTGGYTCSLGAGTCFHVNIYAQLENWDTFECINFFVPGASTFQSEHNYYSTQCQKYIDTLHTMQANQSGQPGAAGNNFQFGLLTPIITFLAGLVLFFIGLGINIGFGGSVFGTGVQGSVGTNRQGSKLAQVLGIGLIVWSFAYSQFATWFTTGILPYGFDGTIGIISIVLNGLFWFGVYSQATSD